MKGVGKGFFGDGDVGIGCGGGVLKDGSAMDLSSSGGLKSGLTSS